MLLPVLANTTQLDNVLPPSSLISVPSTCNDLNHCRTKTDIVWSCLATILVCVWVGLHPNVPKPRKRKKYTRHTGWRDWFFDRLHGLWDDFRLVWWPLAWGRLAMSIWALLAPEFILVWAIRQWYVACDIADDLQYATDPSKLKSTALQRAERRKKKREKEEEEKEEGKEKEKVKTEGELSSGQVSGSTQAILSGDSQTPSTSEVPASKDLTTNTNVAIHTDWTATHSFFILMGGFHFFNGDEPLHPLDRWDVVEKIKNGTLTYLPSEDEIKDRSKGDPISKTIVLGQTAWFVAQCIGRGIQDLTITELEIVTLAYTLVIILMYGFWWNKPLSVDQPVRVQCEGDPPPVHPLSWREISGMWKNIFLGEYDGNVNMSKEVKIPIFYAGELDRSELYLTDLVASIVAIFFGAIHCIAWSFEYPTPAEQFFWRISSIAVVSGPAIWALLFTLVILGVKDKIDVDRWGWESLGIIVTLLSIIAIPIYITARIILLALAFTSLRSLPQAAYQTIAWATFIPHI